LDFVTNFIQLNLWNQGNHNDLTVMNFPLEDEDKIGYWGRDIPLVESICYNLIISTQTTTSLDLYNNEYIPGINQYI